MDVMLQRHCARYIYAIPDGLRELLTDISREVLRSQPEDIYTFIADYLDALLITRENARVCARFVQEMTEMSETIVDLLQNTGMTREEAEQTANVIQGTFTAWSESKGILKEDEDALIARIIEDAGITEAQIQTAAVIIQHAFKAFKMRKQREAELLRGIIDWRVAARSAIKLYRRAGVSPEEAKRAATLIKAAYKGYYTRRALQQMTEKTSYDERYDNLEEVSSEESGEEWDETRKSKGVRIDYKTVVPHVDFGDEELISRDLTSVIDEEVEPAIPQVLGGVKHKTDEEYIKDLVKDIINCIIGIPEEVEVPLVEEMDEDTDDFVRATEETEAPTYHRTLPIPIASQQELDQELQEAQQEMMELKQARSQDIPASRKSDAGEVRKKSEAGEVRKKSEAGEESRKEKTGISQEEDKELVKEDTAEVKEEPTEETTEITKEEPTEVSKEEPVEEIKEEQIEGIKEEPTEEIKEEPTEGIKEEPTEGIKEEPTEGIKEEPTEGIKDEPTEGIKEEPTEEIKEEPIEGIKDEPAEVSKEAVEPSKEEKPEARESIKEEIKEVIKEEPEEPLEKPTEEIPIETSEQVEKPEVEPEQQQETPNEDKLDEVE